MDARAPFPGNFHPAVVAWFAQALGTPTPVQARAWPMIQSGRDTLIAAPTGSGKTLSAFLAALDALFREALEAPLPDETRVVYVSPLKALSNDIQKNLAFPLAGIRAELIAGGLPEIDIRTWVRTGDTPAKDRAAAGKRPPHIVVTTPESLYILLTSASGRAMLKTTRTVIVDEIHAVAPNKRGAHLSLSLERMADLCRPGLQRIGLSATQKPIEDVAHFLSGAGKDCAIVDAGYTRPRDLAMEVPRSPLESVMSGEQWKEVYDRLAQLVNEHRTTLIFVNTRRMVERAARELSERIGENHLAAHHGSLSKEQRLDAELRLKKGELKVLVATASLELGIDIGDVDLACQLGSPRAISAFLQRVGRSGHAVNAVPKGRLFPLSRDELVECAALLDAVRRGELDALTIAHQPLDVLAQQIVAEVAAKDEASADDIYTLVKRAWPYRDLARAAYDAVIIMLAEGFATRRGRRGALIHYDAVNGMLRARRGAKLTAVTSGGAIPDNADYRVMLEPENNFVGTVHEDFAVESLAGDVFQLGNMSYRILRVERGVVRVEDAHGQPPTIPFWLGEAPGRSDELSASVARLRSEFAERVAPNNKAASDTAPASDWLMHQVGLSETAARDLTAYLAAGHAALGCLPTQDIIVFERFFDESGGMQLVLHTPFGSRINRAWGLSLRKRFCRTFNFELQAAATEDNIVLSLTAAHSFDLADVQRYLRAATVRDVLVQALLDAPMFATRWRWVASTSLALPRFRGGKKRPPQLARMDAEDLLCAVFPDQLACAENLTGGAREVPDHPLVNQTIDDCLHEAMDIDGLEKILRRIESGEIRVVTRDLTEPSPLAMEVLAARPYAYLDDAPLEERRTQAVQGRRWMAPESAAELGRLDPEAIARVRSEVWPDARNADELHDALVWIGFLTTTEAAANIGWAGWLDDLAGQKRAARLTCGNTIIWVAAERLPQWQALVPTGTLSSGIAAPSTVAAQSWTPETALVEIVRGRMEGLGPVTAGALAASLPVEPGAVTAALLALQTEGFALRGSYTAETTADEWCDRRLLARIHRYTLKRLRAEIEPVAAKDFLRFLLSWQRLAPDDRMQGPDALGHITRQLEGFQVAAGAWESEILPARIANYSPTWLDDECRAGRLRWTALRRSAATAPIRATPITLLERRHAGLWSLLAPPADTAQLGSKAQSVLAFLQSHGAAFFEDMVEDTQMMRLHVEEGLAELVTAGFVTADSFAGLRALMPAARAERRNVQMENAGRWALLNRAPDPPTQTEAIQHIARVLLARYGVVFWRMLEREAAWLPSWRELLHVYRQMEARGDIRGGRFVGGFSGEQFALPEAIGALRETRRKSEHGVLVSVSGTDPLNLQGILTPGAKLPALSSNRLLYRDGIPIAMLAGGEVAFLEDVPEKDQWALRKVLLRNPSRSRTRNLLTADTSTVSPTLGGGGLSRPRRLPVRRRVWGVG